MIVKFTVENLINIGLPSLKKENAELYFLPLVEAMEKYEVNNPARVSALLGQILVESQYLTKVEENLYYTKPERLIAVYGHHCFPTVEIAQQYIKNPEKLANRVYSKDFNKWLGNGDEASGDGWRFRGMGLLQLTGRYNVQIASNDIGVDFINNSELLKTPKYAALTSAWFFYKNKLNALADQGKFEELTGKVNSKKLELEQRTKIYKKALQILK